MPDYESRPSQTITGTSVAFVLGNLTLGTQYLVQVSLDDSFETGVLQTGFTTLDVPDEPRVASVTAEDQALTVKWNAPSDDGGSPITGYRVQWKVLGEEEYPTANVEVSTANVREVTIRNLENDVTYVVHVQAENEFGPGEWSGEAVGRPNDGPRVESVSATLIRDVSAQVTVTTWYVTSSNRSVYLRFRPQNGTSCASTVNDEDWSRAAGIVSSFNQETAIETVISLAGLAPGTLYCLQASLASTFTDGVIDGDEFRTESEGDPAPPHGTAGRLVPREQDAESELVGQERWWSGHNRIQGDLVAGKHSGSRTRTPTFEFRSFLPNRWFGEWHYLQRASDRDEFSRR